MMNFLGLYLLWAPSCLVSSHWCFIPRRLVGGRRRVIRRRDRDFESMCVSVRTRPSYLLSNLEIKKKNPKFGVLSLYRVSTAIDRYRCACVARGHQSHATLLSAPHALNDRDARGNAALPRGPHAPVGDRAARRQQLRVHTVREKCTRSTCSRCSPTMASRSRPPRRAPHATRRRRHGGARMARRRRRRRRSSPRGLTDVATNTSLSVSVWLQWRSEQCLCSDVDRSSLNTNL